jgi:hypothetical protein
MMRRVNKCIFLQRALAAEKEQKIIYRNKPLSLAPILFKGRLQQELLLQS